MQEAKRQWRINVDQAQQFVNECCMIAPEFSCPSSWLYNAFQVWARASGITKMLNRNSFSQRLTRLGHGIGLLPGSNGGPRKVSNLYLHPDFLAEYGGRMEICLGREIPIRRPMDEEFEKAANEQDFSL
jgi:hypothetical protein